MWKVCVKLQDGTTRFDGETSLVADSANARWFPLFREAARRSMEIAHNAGCAEIKVVAEEFVRQ